MIKITYETFDATVLQSTIPVLVDYFADYCGPCRAMVPVLEELSVAVEGRAKIVAVDAIAEEKLSQQFSIEVVPTLIVFKNGLPIARLVGGQSKEGLLAILKL